MHTKIYNIPKILKKLGIKKGSKKHTDYETAKQWLYYKPLDSYDYEQYLKEVAEYIGV